MNDQDIAARSEDHLMEQDHGDSELLQELVGYLRENRTELREQWAQRISEAELLRVMSDDEIFSEATEVLDNYVDALETGSIETLQSYARELSERMGAVVIALALEVDQVVRLIALDRGGIVDEYLSVPEFYGSLPPGDVIGLAANPTVLSRLTGADPASIRSIARTAPTPAELPPAPDLLAQFAEALGLEGAAYGFDGMTEAGA
jgi:hypothetical protein